MFCACVYLYKFADNYIFVSVGEIRNISYRIYSQETNADLSSGETGQKVSPQFKRIKMTKEQMILIQQPSSGKETCFHHKKLKPWD